jgi:acyl-CoA synthetase (AMP-forming)/AMP-acid ligase II
MFWVGGLVAEWLAAMAVGATTIFTTARGGAMLDLIESERVNYVFIWPHIANQLAAHPSFSERDFSAVQGGSLVAAIPEPLRIRNPIFAGALGMTETAGPHTAYIADMPDRMIGSFGPSSPGMEHRIVHPESRAILPDGVEGELEVRGNTLMLGYVGKERSETFTPDGWFATGDRCRIVEGFVHFSGRVDDMIKCAGANVWPHEVETALRALPGVAAVHVTGVRDVARVSSVGAAIVLEEGATLTESAIRTHAKQALSAFKVPRVIWICRPADLPLTGTNKIDRRRLTELLNWRFGKAKH